MDTETALTPEERTARLVDRQRALGLKMKRDRTSIVNRDFKRNIGYMSNTDVAKTVERMRPLPINVTVIARKKG